MSDSPTSSPSPSGERAEAALPAGRRSWLADALHPPLWLRYMLAAIVFGGALTAIVIFDQNGHSGPPSTENPAAEAQANHESEIVVAQDQAPHTLRLVGAAAPAAALARAISLDMAARIRRTELQGPLQRSSCSPTSRGHSGGLAFRCTVEAGGVSYPFVGVVDVHARAITWCKRDPPPVPSENVPVSRRCRT